MKQTIILIFILLLTACGHNIPTATLTFTKIEKNTKNNDSYFLYFSSDIELLKNLSEKHTGARLACFFNEGKIEKNDFDEKKDYLLKSIGVIKEDTIGKLSKDTYNYFIKVRFIKTKDNTSKDFIKKEDYPKILALLNTKPTCLNCAITAVGYLDIPRRYISNTMCLPKEALIRIIQ